MINGSMKVLLKDRFVPPLPKISACHQNDRSPDLLMRSILVIDEVIEDSIPANQRKEISNMI